ncbi:SoxR reducing system RseC family protein [Aliiglaciecola litoralis]|uniref:SoxR reducing system RseC family protein n=1 Tax=Aliiglaciecola litoralis TaxID=582857 RepID=A0ABP3WWA1_9ALTE
MIEEIGVITAVDKDHIWVETEIKTTCGGCQAQDNCGTGVVAKAFAPKKEKLILRCKQVASVGQRVKLGIEEDQLISASAIVYVLPLVIMIIAALGAQALLPSFGMEHEGWVIGASFFATLLSFKWVKRKATKDGDTKFQPKLLAILPAEEDMIVVKHSH